MEDLGTSGTASTEYVELWTTGQQVKGEFHCAECGYGVTIVRALPLCPMCGGDSWEQATWSPFSRELHLH